MRDDFASTSRDILQSLSASGVPVSPNAMGPLSRVDFAALMAIHDHEEFFLRRVFLDSLRSAYRARREAGEGAPELSPADVRTAMLMLGTAAAEAPTAQFSEDAKRLIKQVCPYCTAQVVAP
jgi:hypothetical protein